MTTVIGAQGSIQFVSSFLPGAKNNLRFYLECTRSQQDLMLTEANKLTCRRSELENCFAVLTLHRSNPEVLFKALTLLVNLLIYAYAALP